MVVNMVLDVTVIGAELSLKLEDMIDQIRTFLADTENSVIAYNSNVAKKDAELTDPELERVKAIDVELGKLQQQIKDMNPDPAKISTLSTQLTSEMAALSQLYVQQATLNSQLQLAIKNNDAVAQNNIIQQLVALGKQITEKQNEINMTHGQLNAEITKRPDPVKLSQLLVKVSSLQAEEYRIYHMRPAALPIALDNLGDVLARLEKEELPRIDKVLDNVPATVQNVNAILNTVHKEDQPRIEAIMDEVPATIASARDVIVRFNTVEQPKIERIMDSVDDTIGDAGEVLTQVKGLFVTTRFEPVDVGKLTPDLKDKLDALQREQVLAVEKLTKQSKVMGAISVPGPVQRPSVPGVSGAGVAAFATDGAGSPAFAGNLYDNQKAYLKQVEREKLQIGRDIDRIRFRRVDTPGVIPQVLGSLRDSLDEAHGILARVNGALGKALGFVDRYSLFIKIGLGISGVAIVVTLVLVPVLLLKVLLFGL
jgi:hypothetical protein